MTARPSIGLLDSGVGIVPKGPVVAERAFTDLPLQPDRLDHGRALADVIWHYAPTIPLVNAQVFGAGMRSSAERLAAGIEWLCRQDALIINMSVGLRDDRPVLRAAIEAALAADRILLAAMPARGRPVFPAAYPGVIKVTGDARCRIGEVSELGDGDAAAEFGACPTDLSGRPRGASFAVAHVAGMLGATLRRSADPRVALRRQARYRGRERRES